MPHPPTGDRQNPAAIKLLTYAMFAMFAMTTDSVGVIIPEVIRTFGLSLTAAGSFQYATMAAIAAAALLLGHLADRWGRRSTIVAGLSLFAAACFLFMAGQSFLFFAVLMGLSGLAIGIFNGSAFRRTVQLYRRVRAGEVHELERNRRDGIGNHRNVTRHRVHEVVDPGEDQRERQAIAHRHPVIATVPQKVLGHVGQQAGDKEEKQEAHGGSYVYSGYI